MVAKLDNFTIEDIRVFRSTVYVTTLEVWDLRRVSTGSNVVLQDYPGQRNRVNYHFKRENGRWIVMVRQVLDRDLG